jgi:hypothetical protein
MLNPRTLAAAITRRLPLPLAAIEGLGEHEDLVSKLPNLLFKLEVHRS